MDIMTHLSSMIGRAIRIGRGGPTSRKGQILAVKSDHLVLHNEAEGIIYYKTDHIKSLSMDGKDYSDLNTPHEGYVKPNFIEADNLQTVLQNMKHRWVQINLGGPDSVEGLLSDYFDDHLLLTVNNEIISLFNFHIKSISYKIANQKVEQEKHNSQDKPNNQDEQAKQDKANKKDKQAKSKDKDKDKDKDKSAKRKDNLKIEL